MAMWNRVDAEEVQRRKQASEDTADDDGDGDNDGCGGDNDTAITRMAKMIASKTNMTTKTESTATSATV